MKTDRGLTKDRDFFLRKERDLSRARSLKACRETGTRLALRKCRHFLARRQTQRARRKIRSMSPIICRPSLILFVGVTSEPSAGEGGEGGASPCWMVYIAGNKLESWHGWSFRRREQATAPVAGGRCRGLLLVKSFVLGALLPCRFQGKTVGRTFAPSIGGEQRKQRRHASVGVLCCFLLMCSLLFPVPLGWASRFDLLCCLAPPPVLCFVRWRPTTRGNETVIAVAFEPRMYLVFEQLFDISTDCIEVLGDSETSGSLCAFAVAMPGLEGLVSSAWSWEQR